MKQTVFIILFFVANLVNSALSAQSITTDTSAVFHFHANVDKDLNPDFEKGRPDFFGRSDMDKIYAAFFTTLTDSSGMKFYPIEYLMALKGTPKSEYPQYSFKTAKKRGNAAFYVRTNIRFENAGGSSSKSSTKMSFGKLSGKKTAQKQNLHMHTEFEIFDTEGNAVRKISTKVSSTEPIALESLDGLNFGGLAKLAKGEKADENAPNPLAEFVKVGAYSVALEIEKAQ